MTPVRTTNRRTKERRIVHVHTIRIETELAENVNNLLNAVTALISTKQQTELLELHKRQETEDMRRRTFERISPTVKTVGGMAVIE